MIIIAGRELVASDERDDFVAAFRDMVTRARGFDGCLHIAVTADSVDPERGNVTKCGEMLRLCRSDGGRPKARSHQAEAFRRISAADDPQRTRSYLCAAFLPLAAALACYQ